MRTRFREVRDGCGPDNHSARATTTYRLRRSDRGRPRRLECLSYGDVGSGVCPGSGKPSSKAREKAARGGQKLGARSYSTTKDPKVGSEPDGFYSPKRNRLLRRKVDTETRRVGDASRAQGGASRSDWHPAHSRTEWEGGRLRHLGFLYQLPGKRTEEAKEP